MPNRSSKAGHIPERTCVVCRKKTVAASLLNFCLIGSGGRDGLVFDLSRNLQLRKSYVCHHQDCLNGLDKWIIRSARKRNKA